VSFTIYRSGPTTEPITVSYELSGVDAADLVEGTAFTGSVLLDIGESEVTLTVGVKGDLTTEADETLMVNVTDTSAGVVGAASAQTTILTDDVAPIAEDDDFTAGPDGTFSDSLFGANGTPEGDRDPDGDTISVVSVNGTPLNGTSLAVLLAYGSATISPTGTISYATDARAAALAEGEVRIETFTYEISDGQGGFDTGRAGRGSGRPVGRHPLRRSSGERHRCRGRRADHLLGGLRRRVGCRLRDRHPRRGPVHRLFALRRGRDLPVHGAGQPGPDCDGDQHHPHPG
jgi:VCBS repeat-containing protein